MARRLLAAGITLFMGYTFGVFTLGGCGGASWPSHGQLPDRVVDKLTDCGRQGPKPLESVSYHLAFIAHVTEEGEEVRVDDVMLTDSTLHIPDVEVCMKDALYGMRTPLDALALRRHNLGPERAGAPQARELLAQSIPIPLLEATAIVLAGLALYAVYVRFLQDAHPTKPRRHPAMPQTEEPPAPAPAISAATAEPTAIAAPTATTVPTTTAVPKARRNPNQMCDDTELDRLEKEKKKLCYSGYAADCAQSRSAKMLGRIPCSAIKLSILQRRACLAARQLIQDKCFGGKPDAGHKQQIDDTQLGIDGCEAQELINCAKGHPMAGL